MVLGMYWGARRGHELGTRCLQRLLLPVPALRMAGRRSFPSAAMQDSGLRRVLVEMASRKRRLLPTASPGRCRRRGPTSELQAAAGKLEDGAVAGPREDGAACAEPWPREDDAAAGPREDGAVCAEPRPREDGAAAGPRGECAACTERLHAGSPHPNRLLWDFFSRPCVALAREFLGQVMARRLADGTELRGRIVETEAYLGGEDQASHSRGGRRSLSNAAMFMSPGTLYVYQIYGVYFCLNVSSQGDGAAVLVRSLEPLQGLDAMRGLRSKRRRAGGKPLKDHQLCNGPSKLCQALDITKSFDQEHLATAKELWMERGPEVIAGTDIVSTSRIGIGYAGEWVSKPLRFYIKGNKCVSITDRKAETMND